jgi:superfamily I DNA/RNA helicase
MALADGIDGAHKSIAQSGHPRIGVLAGPGTGKTSYGLMRRVVRLLEQGLAGERILLVSFTRVAAADLRDKVASLDAPGASDVKATTLHAYCFGCFSGRRSWSSRSANHGSCSITRLI